MAIFPGAKGGDILAWRGVAEVVGELRRRSAERMSSLLYDEGADLLKELMGRLEAEIAFEEGFSADFAKALDELDQARYEDEFAPLLPRFDRLAEQHFRKRESVVALHTLCNACRDGLMRKALQRVEEWLALEGVGSPPVPYCCLASGSIGRSEQTFCVDPSYLLIHGDIPGNDAGYFAQFAYRALALLDRIGLVRQGGAEASMKGLRLCSRTAWRREIVEAPAREEPGRLLDLTRRADLRLICGDEALAEEMINIVRSVLEFRHGELREISKGEAAASRSRAAFAFPMPGLREMGKGIAEMPIGLDFFSRLRVARSGRNKGRFDLEQFALAPLVTNVRMLAINCGLHETGTIARIKGLQERGRLSVELTERLLRAYHDFTRLKVFCQLTEGCGDDSGCFIDPHALGADEGHRLRAGLEAVSGLETIAYLCFSEQG